MSLPLVSILINNYNYGHYLPQAIDSALKQTYPNIEIIIVDDGSLDNSMEVINSYNQKKIISIVKENGGQASAFNTGFAISRGEIICFLDSDDFFYPDKISTIIDILLKNPTIGWAFHNLIYVDAHSNILKIESPIGSISCSEVRDFQYVFEKGRRFTLALPATCGLCITRRVLQKILPMPQATGVTISDNYLKYAALSLSPGMLLNQQLAAQRIHNDNRYTFKNDHKMRAEINVKTGFYLRQNFPHISRFADNRFIEGCGQMIAEAGWSGLRLLPEFKAYFQNHGSLSMLVKWVPKTLLQTIRFKAQGLKGQYGKSPTKMHGQ